MQGLFLFAYLNHRVYNTPVISKWFDKKEKAVNLRKIGYSIRHIEEKLGIPKSTLSGWFKSIKLTENQKNVLNNNWKNALVGARIKAVVWHNNEKEKRVKVAHDDAFVTLNNIDLKNKNILELSLAMLYLGEGAKTNRTAIGNSDPKILKFFLSSMEKLYRLSRRNVKCDLHLRADQSILKMKKFWSNELKIPISNFLSVSFDKRTIGKPTYKNYNGVCVLSYGNIAIQRKLVYLSKCYCENIIK